MLNPGEIAAILTAKLQAGLKLHQQGRLDQAQLLYSEVLRHHPDHPEALHLLGLIAHQTGHHQESVALIDRALLRSPGNSDFLVNRGNAQRGLGQAEAALDSYDQALARNPANHVCLVNRGIVLQQLGRFQAALESHDRAIAVNRSYAEAHGNRGAALHGLGRLEEALTSYDRAIALKPDLAWALNARACVLQQVGRSEEALASFDRAVALQPGYLEAWNNRGNCLLAMGRLDAALASYDQAIALAPGFPPTHDNRGLALHRLGRLEEALASHDRAIALAPPFAEAHGHRGMLLHLGRRLPEALASCDRAIALNPGLAEVHVTRGHVLQDLMRFDEALASYDRALVLRPDTPFLEGARLNTQMNLCDWSGFGQRRAHLLARLESGETAVTPFILLALADDPALQRKVAEAWGRHHHPAIEVAPFPERPAGDRIRIGYFSANYQNHAVAHLISELIELHDRERFEIIAFSYGAETGDPERARLKAGFDRFLDVRDQTDLQVAQAARALGIDIAVDLMGFTLEGRPGIFSHRVAPVQVNYLGFPGTLGLPWMDYVIGDPVLIPEPRHFSEKVVFMPDSYLVNDRKRRIAERVYTRAEAGLPPEGFVFCCLNNAYKISPETFGSWMRILAQVPGSVLWLRAEHALTMANLRGAMAAAGLDPARLHFAGRMPLAEHLSRERLADLFLDSLPYNAHTTASDALWSGLPLLTLAGQAFASRVAASLLHAAGLPELVTTSREAFESLAVDLARDPERLAGIRARVVANRDSCPLFDTPRWTRNLEAAFEQMHARAKAGLAPEEIRLQDPVLPGKA